MNDNRKQTTALVVMILGCVTLFVTKILPLTFGFVMSMKDVSFQGVATAPWVGFRNFAMLTQSFGFMESVMNTIRINALSLLMALLLTFIALWALNQVKCRKLYSIFAVMMVLPYFIPTAVLVKAIAQLDVEHIQQFGLYYLIIQAIKMSSLTIALSLVFRQLKGIKVALVGIGIVALLQLVNALSVNMDAMLLLSNPLNYESMGVIETYTFRSGLQQMNLGSAQAAWIVKYIIEFFCVLTAVGLGYALVSRLGKASNVKSEDTSSLNTLGIIVCSVISLLVLGLLVKSFLPTGGESIMPQINGISTVIYFFMVLLTAMVVSILAATLAYPLTVKNTAIQIIYSMVIAITAYAGTLSMHQFMLFKGVGIFNTLLAVMLSDFMPVILILGFAMAYYGLKDHSRYQGKPYSAVIMKPVIGATALVFAAKWGSYIATLVYTAGPDKATPALNYYMVMTQMGGDVSPALTAMLVVPSLLVLVVTALLIIPRKSPAH